VSSVALTSRAAQSTATDPLMAIVWHRRLGFVKEWEHQFEPGFPRFVSVARGTSACTCRSTRATLVRTP
jgi:hypothetical protein